MIKRRRSTAFTRAQKVAPLAVGIKATDALIPAAEVAEVGRYVNATLY
jgi:hypothetical protein